VSGYTDFLKLVTEKVGKIIAHCSLFSYKKERKRDGKLIVF
jgi:hypothetical protein